MALAPTQNQTKGPSQEYLLLDYLQRLGRSVEGRMAVHIHLSRLRPQNRQDHHVRIAATTFEGMTQTYDGQVFILSSSDLFFVCKDASIDDIDAAILKVRHLFNEDPSSLPWAFACHFFPTRLQDHLVGSAAAHFGFPHLDSPRLAVHQPLFSHLVPLGCTQVA